MGDVIDFAKRAEAIAVERMTAMMLQSHRDLVAGRVHAALVNDREILRTMRRSGALATEGLDADVADVILRLDANCEELEAVMDRMLAGSIRFDVEIVAKTTLAIAKAAKTIGAARMIAAERATRG